jgi:hypothetical protein
MEKLNLFNYSPKELSLDAFLKYFILWSYESDNINKTKKLFLREEDWEEEVEDIKVKLQVSYGKKKADIVVYFKLKGTEELVVFENKTHSTTSTNQLESYKKDGTYQYVYLKLGYINSREKTICKKSNYKTLNSSFLLNIVRSVNEPDEIIKQFKDYLENSYVDVENQINESFDSGKIYYQFGNQDAQLLTLDKLGNSFGEFELDKTKLTAFSNKYHIQYSSNTGGNPWSELVFIECTDKTPEAVFWRIDKRDNRYYIRLNQYSYTKGQSESAKQEKTLRLKDLRNFSRDYFLEKENIKLGKLSNRGENEREILIFFMDENNFKSILEVIPEFSKAITKKYVEVMKSH